MSRLALCVCCGTSVCWIPALGLFGSWFSIGYVLERPVLFLSVASAVLAGVATREAGMLSEPSVTSIAYRDITWDCAIFAIACMLGAYTMASRVAVTPFGRDAMPYVGGRKRQWWLLFPALISLLYVCIKAGVRTLPWPSVNLSCAVLAAVLPFLQLLDPLHLWRWANVGSAVEAEAAVFKGATKAPFVQYRAAGMHTIAFGRPALDHVEATAFATGRGERYGAAAASARRAVGAAQTLPSNGTTRYGSVATAATSGSGGSSDAATPLTAAHTEPAAASPRGAAAMPSSAGAGSASGSAVDDTPAIVLLHGYASGSALFMFNIDDLVARGWRVYSVDWLGCGCSERPNFWPRSTDETERFFLEALDAWRVAHGLQRMVLLAHSMGGYLACNYAMRYPGRVAHLLLASPGGVPVNPNPDASVPTQVPRGQPTPEQRAAAEAEVAAGPAGGMSAAAAALGSSAASSAAGAPAKPSSPTPRPIPSLLWRPVRFLWDRNFTPGWLLRTLGPCGACMARGGTRGRFKRVTLEKPLDGVIEPLAEYFHHNIAGEGSGEYGLTYIFAPGAWGRQPVGPRLVAAARSGVLRPSDVALTFAYGSTVSGACWLAWRANFVHWARHGVFLFLLRCALFSVASLI